MRALARAAARLAACSALAASASCGKTSDSEPGSSGSAGSESSFGGASNGGLPPRGGGGSSAEAGSSLGAAGASATADGKGGGANEPAPGDPLADEDELCTDYLEIWMKRQAEREPGEPIPKAGAPAPCFECLRAQELPCQLPEGECAAATACVRRHCLCTAEDPVAESCAAEDYPADVCGCIQRCAPAGIAQCQKQWASYMRCAVMTCSPVCR